MANSIAEANRISQFLRLEERYHTLLSLKTKIKDSSLDNKIHRVCLNSLKIISEMTIEELSKTRKKFLYILCSHGINDLNYSSAIEKISKFIQFTFFLLPLDCIYEVVSLTSTVGLQSLLCNVLDAKYFAYKKTNSQLDSQVLYLQQIIRIICCELVGRNDHVLTKWELIKLVKLACYVKGDILTTDIKKLNAWKSDFTVEELHLIFSVCPKLKILYFDECNQLTDDHFIHLNEQTPELHTLKISDRGTNTLTDAFITYLPESLEVFECQVNKFFTDVMAESLPRFLTTLILKRCPLLTNGFFKALPSSLTTIDVNSLNMMVRDELRTLNRIELLSARIDSLRLILNHFNGKPDETLQKLEKFDLKRLNLRCDFFKPSLFSFPSVLRDLKLDIHLTDAIIDALPIELTSLRLEHAEMFKPEYLKKLPVNLTSLGFEYRDHCFPTKDKALQALTRYTRLTHLFLGKRFRVNIWNFLTHSSLHFIPTTLKTLRFAQFPTLPLDFSFSFSQENLTTLELYSTIVNPQDFKILPATLTTLIWRAIEILRPKNEQAFKLLPLGLKNLSLFGWYLYDEEIATLPNSIRRLHLIKTAGLTAKCLEKLPEEIEEVDLKQSTLSNQLTNWPTILLEKGIQPFVNFKQLDFMNRETDCKIYAKEGRRIRILKMSVGMSGCSDYAFG